MIDDPKTEIPPYVPTQKERDDIAYALKFKQECYQQTQDERKTWRTNYWRYKLARKLSEYDYIPDVPIGLTYNAVERWAGSLPGRELGFRAKPVGVEDTKNALLFGEVLNQAWQSPKIMDGPNKMEVVKKNLGAFGNCFAQAYWETVVNEDGETVKSDPCFWPLNIFDVYYNKFISEVDDLPEIGYQSVVSLQWLKTNGKALGYKNIKYVQGFTPKAQGQDESGASIDSQETQSGKGPKDAVRLFEIQSNSTILTLALDDRGPVCLRKTKNKLGQKNIVLFRLKRSPIPNRLLGDTDVSRGGQLEDAIQRVMNQAIFNTLLVDNPNFTFDATDRNIDPRTFVTAPGAGIPRGKNPDALTPIQFPSHLSDSLTMVNTLMERYKEIVNLPDILAGQSQGNTATSDSLNDQNAKASVEKVVDGMKETMKKLGLLLRKMYEVYGPDSITVQLRSPELIQELAPAYQGETLSVDVPKSDLVLERDIDIQVDFTSQNKAVLSRRLVEFLSLTAQDPSVSPQLRLKAYEQWLEFNDFTDLALTFSEAASTGQTSDLSKADEENSQMGQGTAVPPTPNASMAHTQRHVDFMRRADTGPEIDRLLQGHIEGEIQQHQSGVPSPTEGEAPPAGVAPTAPANPLAEASTIGQ